MARLCRAEFLCGEKADFGGLEDGSAYREMDRNAQRGEAYLIGIKLMDFRFRLQIIWMGHRFQANQTETGCWRALAQTPLLSGKSL